MKPKLKVYYYQESERAVLKLSKNNYMFSDFNNHNFSNTLTLWLEKNNFSEEIIQYILDSWCDRDIFDILGEFFEIETIFKDYHYEYYDRRCIEYENKEERKEHLKEAYHRWYVKSSKAYRRKETSVKVA